MGVDYRKALSPRQALEMHSFLQTLAWAAKKTIEAGAKPNIDLCITFWRGTPVTEGEKRQRRRIYEANHPRKARLKNAQKANSQASTQGKLHQALDYCIPAAAKEAAAPQTLGQDYA